MRYFLTLCLLPLVFLAACSDSSAPEESPALSPPADDSTARANSGEKPVFAAVNYPLAFFAERIAGDAATVYFPEIEGDPAFWEPGDKEVTRFQQADAILRNGATYAKWTDTVTLPGSTQVDTSAAFSDRYITEEDGVAHSHGDGEVHSHAGVVFTTWMDLSQARQQADAVLAALQRHLPSAEEELAARHAELADELDQLDAAFEATAEKIGDRPLVASHPVYQYFARRYGLDLKSVHWEPDALPDDAARKELRDLLAEHPATAMLWEGEPIPEAVELIASEDYALRSVVVDPCGNRPEEGDFLGVMRENVVALESLAE